MSRAERQRLIAEGLERPRVALLIETSNSYARGLLRGIHRYIEEHASWAIYLAEQARGDRPPAWLKSWNGEGIIARIENQLIADAVMATGAAVVDVSAARIVPRLAWVETNDEIIAELAAEHLLERGLRNFAYCGDDAFNWSVWRRDRFVQKTAEAGFACHVFPVGKEGSAGRRPFNAALIAWLKALPKPVGIMACYDQMGRQLLDICRSLQLNVPDEVAVIGVDNDELLCELSDPPLSSVEPNALRTGYEAAALLDLQMNGEAVPPGHTIRVTPTEIFTRRSTDVFSVEDEDVAAALRFIRSHACEGIKVADVLKAVPLSRSALHQRFLKLVGRTLHDEILQVRIRRVVQFLKQSDMTLADIAERVGFKHAENLSVAFKKQLGVSPSQYRLESAGAKGN